MTRLPLDDVVFVYWQVQEISVLSKKNAAVVVVGGGAVVNHRGMRLTTHIRLVPRLRMFGALPPLPLCAFMACVETILPLPAAR